MATGLSKIIHFQVCDGQVLALDSNGNFWSGHFEANLWSQIAVPKISWQKVKQGVNIGTATQQQAYSAQD